MSPPGWVATYLQQSKINTIGVKLKCENQSSWSKAGTGNYSSRHSNCIGSLISHVINLPSNIPNTSPFHERDNGKMMWEHSQYQTTSHWRHGLVTNVATYFGPSRQANTQQTKSPSTRGSRQEPFSISSDQNIFTFLSKKSNKKAGTFWSGLISRILKLSTRTVNLGNWQQQSCPNRSESILLWSFLWQVATTGQRCGWSQRRHLLEMLSQIPRNFWPADKQSSHFLMSLMEVVDLPYLASKGVFCADDVLDGVPIWKWASSPRKMCSSNSPSDRTKRSYSWLIDLLLLVKCGISRMSLIWSLSSPFSI